MKSTFQYLSQVCTVAFLMLAISIAHAAVTPKADTTYTIQLGIFKDNMSISDFDEVLDAGYPYSEKFANNDQMAVFVSNYKHKSKANAALSYLQGKGYSEAFISERPLAKGNKAYVVQIASQQSRDFLNWKAFAKAGQIHLILQGTNIKITSVPFLKKEKAEEKMKILQKIGFKDAFVRAVNTLEIHKVNRFNTVDDIQFMPIAISSDPIKNKDGLLADTDTQFTPKGITAYEAVPQEPVAIDKTNRISVKSFQKFLTEHKAYTGTIDGKYGKGTAKGVDMMENISSMYQRYQLLSTNMPIKKSPVQLSELDAAISSIPTDPKDAYVALGKENSPIAKAYRAYILFIADAKSNQEKVNNIMNEAIQEAYKDFKEEDAPFDFNSTYAYKDLEQLILHTRYIQAALKDEPITPCWLFTRHKDETYNAFSKATAKGLKEPTMPSCAGFMEWNSIIILKTIATDLNPNEGALTDEQKKQERMFASRRNQLYLIPRALNEEQVDTVLAWNDKVWAALDKKNQEDKFFAKFGIPFKLAYHKAWIKLEDYYLTKGFKKAEANTLALCVLQATVGTDIEAYL